MFLSVVVVVRNAAGALEGQLAGLIAAVAPLVADYEILVIDNASGDGSVDVLQRLTAEGGLPNLQVFALTAEMDPDTAVWAGLDSALGDVVAVFDPTREGPEAIHRMLESASAGADLVFAANASAPPEGLLHRALATAFGWLYAAFHGVAFVRDTPPLRLLSRRVVNLVLAHPAPALTYRQLGQLAGLPTARITYAAPVQGIRPRSLGASVDRGLRLLTSTTRAPLRIVTGLSTLAAALNVLYSGYVLAVYALKADGAPGWTTLSLQQSGSFLLISIILLVLGEYVLQATGGSRVSPPWHVAREFTSVSVSRRQRLNVVDGPGGA